MKNEKVEIILHNSGSVNLFLRLLLERDISRMRSVFYFDDRCL